MSAENPTLDQDEPLTPLWFTLLGVAVFLFGGIFALVAATAAEAPETSSAAETEAPAAEAPSAEAAAPKLAEPVDPHAGHGH